MWGNFMSNHRTVSAKIIIEIVVFLVLIIIYSGCSSEKNNSSIEIDNTSLLDTNTINTTVSCSETSTTTINSLYKLSEMSFNSKKNKLEDVFINTETAASAICELCLKDSQIIKDRLYDAHYEENINYNELYTNLVEGRIDWNISEGSIHIYINGIRDTPYDVRIPLNVFLDYLPEEYEDDLNLSANDWLFLFEKAANNANAEVNDFLEKYYRSSEYILYSFSGTWQKINKPLSGELGWLFSDLVINQFLIFTDQGVKYVYRWENAENPYDDLITYSFYSLTVLDTNFYCLTNDEKIYAYIIFSPEDQILYIYDVEKLTVDNPTYVNLLQTETDQQFQYVAIGDAYLDLINPHVEVSEAINNANLGFLFE